MEQLNMLLGLIAILAIGVVYGVDVFFAIIGKKALARSSDQGMVEVIGRIHEVADVRMPFFGAIGFISSVILVFSHGLSVLSGWLCLFAVIAIIIYLIIYSTISKPINIKLTESAKTNQVPSNARALQNRWDSVIMVRALLLTIALILIYLSM